MAPHFPHYILLAVLACEIGVAGDTSMKGSKCAIHQVNMTQEEIPVVYGKPLASQEYSQARESHFPNAHERCVFGGCDPKPNKKAKVMVCPKCTEARNLWLSQHQVRDSRI
jgi:hypothetical protein